MAPLFLTLCVPRYYCCRIAEGHTRTHARSRIHSRRSTVRGCHKGKSLKRGCRVATKPLTAAAVLPKQQQREVKKKKENESYLGFAWAWLALAGRKANPRRHARFRDFEHPEHAPRSPAGTHTWAVVYTRPPCMLRSQEREKRPAAGREKFCFPQLLPQQPGAHPLLSPSTSFNPPTPHSPTPLQQRLPLRLSLLLLVEELLLLAQLELLLLVDLLLRLLFSSASASGSASIRERRGEEAEPDHELSYHCPRVICGVPLFLKNNPATTRQTSLPVARTRAATAQWSPDTW